jgi:hypothetical protein
MNSERINDDWRWAGFVAAIMMRLGFCDVKICYPAAGSENRSDECLSFGNPPNSLSPNDLLKWMKDKNRIIDYRTVPSVNCSEGWVGRIVIEDSKAFLNLEKDGFGAIVEVEIPCDTSAWLVDNWKYNEVK